MELKPRLAVVKFASCDGCQLQLLSCEDELLDIADSLDIVRFHEATSRIESGPYDITLVEGSITTYADRRAIQEVRQNCKYLVTIGACASSGGIQALKNWADSAEYVRYVYAQPKYIDTLSTSTAISDHVKVDFELRGCPINKRQLLEVVRSLLGGRKPRTPAHSVCLDCKRSGIVCIAVSKNIPCVGPITQAGCGALCPRYNRGCYGCFGPTDQSNCDSLATHYLETRATANQLVPLLRNFNANAPAYRDCGDRVELMRDPEEPGGNGEQ